jgi:hypothetical protein
MTNTITKSLLKLHLAIILSLLILSYSSCKKDESIVNETYPCARIDSTRIRPIGKIALGEKISLSVAQIKNVSYSWTGPLNFFGSGNSVDVTDNAEYKYKGWYYLKMSHEGCLTKIDSVYVSIPFPQGIPTCSPEDNSASFKNGTVVPKQDFYGVSFHGNQYEYLINAISTFGDVYIYMSPYWTTHELEDGIYTTSNESILSILDQEKIKIEDNSLGIRWVAQSGQSVHVSHINGKKRITICGLKCNAYFNTSELETSMYAQFTEP